MCMSQQPQILHCDSPVVLFKYLKYLKSIQVQSSGENQSLPVVSSKAGMSSTSSHDLVFSDSDLDLDLSSQ